MNAEVVETVAGVARLLRRAAELASRQVLAQPNDHLLGVGVHGVRVVMRPPGPRLKSRRPLTLIAADQLLHPVARDPIVTSHLTFGAAFNNDSSDG
jgi:hypothetical protein